MTLTKAHNRMISSSPASVVDFGATGVGDETSIFEAAADAAVANGSKTVVIPLPTFSVSVSGANAKGCTVVGSNTTLTSGHIENAHMIYGVTVSGIKQDYKAYHPSIPYDDSNKLIQRFDAHTYYVHVPSTHGGYVLHLLGNNSTTANESLAVTNSDQTQWRVTKMLRSVEVLTGHLTASAENGTWTSVDLSTGVPAYTSGVAYQYTRSTSIGAWKEFTIDVPEDGFVSVTFLTGSSASNNVDVLIDGVVVESGINTLEATSQRWTKIYRTKPGTRVVKVENKTAGSTGLNIVGVNFSPLKTQRTDVSIDSYGYYRNSSDVDPIVNSSANDYAIWDLDANLWGGSYHGGEKNFTEEFYVNGSLVNLSTVGDFIVGNRIDVVQTSDIDWTAFGGTLINVRAERSFIMGGHILATTFNGEVRSSNFFTTLCGVSEDFTTLVAPDKVDLSVLPDRARHSLPQGNFVEYSAANNQTFKITHSMFNYSQQREGGPQVWHVVGSYNKYYNALVTSGEMICDNVHCVSIFQCT